MNTPAPLNDPADSTAKDQASPAPQSEAQPESKVEPPKICLDQFLKTCGVETGGQAKRMIQGGEILVNNEVETRRRKKLVPGDEVQLYDDIFVVALAEPEATEPEATEPEATEPEATEPEATEPEATEPETTEPTVTT